jgi:hypothetical protein
MTGMVESFLFDAKVRRSAGRVGASLGIYSLDFA